MTMRNKQPLPESMLTESDIDRVIAENGVRNYVAGMDINDPPEFQEHECWRMLLVWPDDAEPDRPGRVTCSGCDSVWRFVEEYRP
jgi:hypothetical protein